MPDAHVHRRVDGGRKVPVAYAGRDVGAGNDQKTIKSLIGPYQRRRIVIVTVTPFRGLRSFGSAGNTNELVTGISRPAMTGLPS